MGDPTTAKIDSFFNTLDAVIDEGGALITRIASSSEKVGAAKQGKVIDIDPAPRAPAPSAMATPRRYRIIESIDAQTGITTFVVTDDITRTECPNAESAERVRRALENA